MTHFESKTEAFLWPWRVVSTIILLMVFLFLASLYDFFKPIWEAMTDG